MGREDYYRRKARELLVAACAPRDSGAADWLRAMAFGYERLAKKAAHSPHEQYLPRLKRPDHGRPAVNISSLANGALGEHWRLRLSRQPQAVDSVIGASRGRRTVAHPDRHDRPHG